MSNDPIHIVLVADARFRIGLEATRRSIVESCSAPERLVFHEFDETNIDAQSVLADFGSFKGSVMAYVRIYLGSLLPDLDFVVYADVDTLWFRDVAELWDLRDPSKTIQWCEDALSTSCRFRDWAKVDCPHYACSGVALLNLRRFRETDIVGRCLGARRLEGCPPYFDQDVLNYALAQEERGLLPRHWDCIFTPPGNWRYPAAVLHLTGCGRVFHELPSAWVPQYELWWRYVNRDKKEYPLRRRAVIYLAGRFAPILCPAVEFFRGIYVRLFTPRFAAANFFDRTERMLVYSFLLRAQVARKALWR